MSHTSHILPAPYLSRLEPSGSSLCCALCFQLCLPLQSSVWHLPPHSSPPPLVSSCSRLFQLSSLSLFASSFPSPCTGVSQGHPPRRPGPALFQRGVCMWNQQCPLPPFPPHKAQLHKWDPTQLHIPLIPPSLNICTL